MRPNPFDEFPEFDKPAVVDIAFTWIRAWRKKWEPILSEWGVALDEVQNTDPMSIEATLLRWRWRALNSERKLEAIKKLCEEELEALKDYDAKVEKFIYRQILRKILEDQSSEGSTQ